VYGVDRAGKGVWVGLGVLYAACRYNGGDVSGYT
jgi:hypothetical protein